MYFLSDINLKKYKIEKKPSSLLEIIVVIEKREYCHSVLIDVSLIMKSIDLLII